MRLRSLPFILVLLAIFCPPASGEENHTVLFALEDRDNFPYYLTNGAGLSPYTPGTAVELLTLTCKKLGVKAKFVRMPWNRCKNSLKYGSVDGIFMASYAPEKRTLGLFPMKAGRPDPDKRMALLPFAVYKKKSSNLIWNGGYFNKGEVRVGAPLGYAIVDEMRAMGLDVDESPDTEHNFKKLLLDRLDAVIAPELAGDQVLKKNPKEFAGIVKMDKPFATKPYYLMLSRQFSRREPDLAARFWDVMEQVRESKEYRDLARKYLE
ncbi:MAG: transporter substrate-binding domain-containing protein [Thermodesulfobacteriota bacterium]